MIIKFLANGTGDPQLAASYLIGEQDHLGDQRAGVEIVRGDPIVFAAIASSLNFKYCYTSIVIAWSPEDQVTHEQRNEVLDLLEEHLFSGLGPEQYHMTAVMHADDDGTSHLHVLIPRVELTTGKSLNVAPPGHRHYFDPLRDFLNHKYGWVRPDDPTRLKKTKPKNHHVLQNASAVKAGLKGQAKKTRVELIDAYIEQRIILGSINNRDELVHSLQEIADIGQIGNKSISIKYQNTRDRLEGEFYRAGFSFDAYRQDRTRQTGIRPILRQPQEKSTECSAGLSELLERMETVRRKRAEYNQKYYRTKVSQNEATIGQAAEISYALGATVPEYASRETERRRRVNSIQDKDGDAVSGLNEFAVETTAIFESAQKRDHGAHSSDIREQESASGVQQRVQEQQLANDRTAQKSEPSSTEPRFEYAKAKNSDPGSITTNSRTHRKDEATVVQHYVVPWDVRCIKYPFPDQAIHLNIGGINERNTVTAFKKPIDLSIRGDNSKSESTAENTERGNSNTPEYFSRATGLHQRTREIAEATARLSRTHAQRKLALEQEAQRYECEVNRKRQDNQGLSRRNQQRDFLERTHRFFGNIKEQIGKTFRRIMDQFTDRTTDRSESRAKFEALSQRFNAVGIDRLVNIARRRTQRRQRIENVKGFKQDLERSNELEKQRLAMNTISAELSQIRESYPQLELKLAMGYVSRAESCFHEFRDASESDEEKDLYLSEYIYSIEECFKSLKIKLKVMQPDELDALKGLATVIEGHLAQIKLETITGDSVADYHSAKHEVKHLVEKFRSELSQQGLSLSNKSSNAKDVSHSDERNSNSELNRRPGSDDNTFSY